MQYSQRFSRGLFGFAFFSVLALAGCGGQSQAPAPTQSANAPAPVASAPAPPAAPAVSPVEAATITGKVTFQGAPSKMPKVSMTKEATCNLYNKTHPHFVQDMVVNPNKTLQYVFVYVKSGLKQTNFAPPGTPVTLDQKNCWYDPHAIGVMAGQPINVVNSDPGVLHNIHFMPKLNPPQNFGQPGPHAGSPPPSKTVVFQKPEMIPVKCDVHSWMHAFVGVFPNPYYAVTDDKGNFTIKDLPPGNYTIEAWQEKMGTQDAQVTVGKKQTKSVTITFKS